MFYYQSLKIEQVPDVAQKLNFISSTIFLDGSHLVIPLFKEVPVI